MHLRPRMVTPGRRHDAAPPVPSTLRLPTPTSPLLFHGRVRPECVGVRPSHLFAALPSAALPSAALPPRVGALRVYMRAVCTTNAACDSPSPPAGAAFVPRRGPWWALRPRCFVSRASCRSAALRVASQRSVAPCRVRSAPASYKVLLHCTSVHSFVHGASFTAPPCSCRGGARLHPTASPRFTTSLRPPRPTAALRSRARRHAAPQGLRARRSGAAVGAGLTAARVHTHADRGGRAWPMPAPRHRHRAHSRVTAAHARRCGRA